MKKKLVKVKRHNRADTPENRMDDLELGMTALARAYKSAMDDVDKLAKQVNRMQDELVRKSRYHGVRLTRLQDAVDAKTDKNYQEILAIWEFISGMDKNE